MTGCLTAAMPLIMPAYAGLAEAAAEIALRQAKRRPESDPTLLSELDNHLTMAQLAVDDMVRLARDLDCTTSLELTSAILTRKTIAAQQVLATVGKAKEVAGGAGFYRGLGLERLFQDAQGARLHPLPASRQHQFSERVALGLDPIAPVT